MVGDVSVNPNLGCLLSEVVVQVPHRGHLSVVHQAENVLGGGVDLAYGAAHVQAVNFFEFDSQIGSLMVENLPSTLVIHDPFQILKLGYHIVVKLLLLIIVLLDSLLPVRHSLPVPENFLHFVALRLCLRVFFRLFRRFDLHVLLPLATDVYI